MTVLSFPSFLISGLLEPLFSALSLDLIGSSRDRHLHVCLQALGHIQANAQLSHMSIWILCGDCEDGIP